MLSASLKTKNRYQNRRKKIEFYSYIRISTCKLNFQTYVCSFRELRYLYKSTIRAFVYSNIGSKNAKLPKLKKKEYQAKLSILVCTRVTYAVVDATKRDDLGPSVPSKF